MRVMHIILMVLALRLPLYARGIPLDSVYLSTSSAEYQKLFFTRLDYYQSIGAQFIDSGIAYAGWLNGKQVAYIKEYGNTNVVIINTIATRKHTRCISSKEQLYQHAFHLTVHTLL